MDMKFAIDYNFLVYLCRWDTEGKLGNQKKRKWRITLARSLFDWITATNWMPTGQPFLLLSPSSPGSWSPMTSPSLANQWAGLEERAGVRIYFRYSNVPFLTTDNFHLHKTLGTLARCSCDARCCFICRPWMSATPKRIASQQEREGKNVQKHSALYASRTKSRRDLYITQ